MNGKSLYKLAVNISNYSVRLGLLEKMAANFGDSIISDDGNSNNSLSLLSAAVAHQQDAPGSNIIAGGGGMGSDNEYKTLFSETICSSSISEMDEDMILRQSVLTFDVTMYAPKSASIKDLLDAQTRKTIILRRATTGSMIGQSHTQSAIEAEVRLSEKNIETLQSTVTNAKNYLESIVKEKADLLPSMSSARYKSALEQLLGRNGIMAGCGYPTTASEYTTNKSLFSTMMKNKSTSITPTLFWTSLVTFTHPVTKEKQEDRYALVTMVTDKHGSHFVPPEKWYSISLIIERVNTSTKQLAKPNSSLVFSSDEVDSFLSFFKTNQQIKCYFPITVGSKTSHQQTDDQLIITDDNLKQLKGISHQLHFNTGYKGLAILLHHSATMIKQKQQQQKALPPAPVLPSPSPSPPPINEENEMMQLMVESMMMGKNSKILMVKATEKPIL